ncbi:MAG: hypothetical protein AB7L09_00915 [Nitrospira sp.]
MQLDTFYPGPKTDLHFPVSLLCTLPCGLISCPLDYAYTALPELKGLYDSAPVDDPKDWIIDVKIHMLQPDTFPCIPDWHTDAVPRGADGKTQFDNVTPEAPMWLWVSGHPETVFAANKTELDRIDTHGDLADNKDKFDVQMCEAQRWYRFTQLSPHRGRAAEKFCWRIFARITHKSIAPKNPTGSVVRRHAQVYLDSSRVSW